MKPVCKFFQWSRRNDPNPMNEFRADVDRFYLLAPNGSVFSTTGANANGRWWSLSEVPANADYIGEFQMPDHVWRRYGFH